MRRLPRSLPGTPVTRVTLSRQTNVCVDCRRSLLSLQRQQCSPFSNSSRPFYAEKLPVSEKFRRKLWGTDNPPGLKDPYDPTSPMNIPDPEPGSLAESAEESRLATQRPIAATAIEPDTSEYSPATSWEGLEQIGSNSDEWRKSQVDYRFESFATEEAVDGDEEILRAVHRATVELLTCLDLGVDIANVSFIGTESGEDFTQGAIIKIAEDGSAAVEFEDPSMQQTLRDALTGENEPALSEEENAEEFIATAEAESDIIEEESLTLLAPLDTSFLSLPLADSSFKFALLKRAFQLTNRPIRDAEIASIKQLEQLYKLLIVPTKPPRLAEELLASGQLDLPNVKILPRKETLEDKETSIGRWKVIREVLREKGLEEYPRKQRIIQ
jgi:hypothetical protein